PACSGLASSSSWRIFRASRPHGERTRLLTRTFTTTSTGYDGRSHRIRRRIRPWVRAYTYPEAMRGRERTLIPWGCQEAEVMSPRTRQRAAWGSLTREQVVAAAEQV